MRKILLSALSALATIGCGPNLKLPDVCEKGDWVIAGNPHASVQTVAKTYNGPVNTSVLDKLGSNVQVHASLSHLTLTALSGATSFDFAESFSAAITGPQGSGLPSAEIARFDRAGKPTTATLDIPVKDVDVVPYVKGGKVSAQVSFTGTAPAVDTHVVIDVCVSPSATYHP